MLAPSRKAAHSSGEKDNTGPTGSRELRTRTDSSANATSTQLPEPDAVLLRQAM